MTVVFVVVLSINNSKNLCPVVVIVNCSSSFGHKGIVAVLLILLVVLIAKESQQEWLL